MRILVAEDELVIAVDLAERLAEAGHSVIGPFTRRAEVMDWIAHDLPDAAVLDFQLLDGSCEDAVRELRGHGVPIVAFTAAGETLPEDLAEVVAVPKPATVEHVASALERVMRE
jgi:DNA-binding response OmpR family regulator